MKEMLKLRNTIAIMRANGDKGTLTNHEYLTLAEKCGYDPGVDCYSSMAPMHYWNNDITISRRSVTYEYNTNEMCYTLNGVKLPTDIASKLARSGLDIQSAPRIGSIRIVVNVYNYDLKSKKFINWLNSKKAEYKDYIYKTERIEHNLRMRKGKIAKYEDIIW